MKKKVNAYTGKLSGLFKQKRLHQRSRIKPGAAPGSVEFRGEKRLEEIQLTIHDYDESSFNTIPIDEIESSLPYLKESTVTWIKVNGLHDVEKMKTIWDFFDIHPLAREDIVNPAQRPKIDVYDDHLFIVTRGISFKDEVEEQLESEQICVILGKNYVLSFQETDKPIFDPVIKRLTTGSPRIRKSGSDYLAYALVDTVVDHYYHAMDLIGDQIENLEEEIIKEANEENLHRIHHIRRALIQFRKSVWSLRDALNSLIRDDTTFFKKETKIYLRDVYDHVVQIIDTLENYREMIFGIYDMYMSTLSNKMNEVMKVLTVIATIFIPLTFIAGIYGMNFNPDASPWNMPELEWYYGYPFSFFLMLLMAAGMLYYFRKKNWF